MSGASAGVPQVLVPLANGGGGGGIGTGKELSHPPSDGVSSLRFSRHSDHLLVSSWDKTMRLYDAEANVPMGVFVHAGPVLDCCFHDDSSGFSAGSDQTVRRLAFSSGRSDLLGRHDGPVRCVEYSNTTGQVITGSWDKTIKFWDPRGVHRAENTLVGTYIQPERVYSLSLAGYKLVVATAGRHVNVYDLRFALGSVDGRVAMEFFNQSESTLCKKYAFKCHRLTEDGKDIAYPVNAISFHPIYGTFATGGCDRLVNVWDGANRRRLFQYPRYPSSIAALSFSRDGSLLAVASSYTYEKGDIPHESDAIFIRDVNEVEVKPRPRTCPAPPQ